VPLLHQGEEELRRDGVPGGDLLGTAPGEPAEDLVRQRQLSLDAIGARELAEGAPGGLVDVPRQQVGGGVGLDAPDVRDVLRGAEQPLELAGDELLV
jgi:hypothetical protein